MGFTAASSGCSSRPRLATHATGVDALSARELGHEVAPFTGVHIDGPGRACGSRRPAHPPHRVLRNVTSCRYGMTYGQFWPRHSGRSDAGLQPFRGRPAIALNSAVRAFACGSAGGRSRGWDEAGVGRGTGHVGCDGGVLSVVVPRPRPRLRTSGEGRVGRADPCCCLRPPRLGGVGAVMEVPWPQGRPARSNSCWSRGRRRWVWRSSAIRSSTCASCSVFAASLRMVASRRAARR